jgi:hypothetical protein
MINVPAVILYGMIVFVLRQEEGVETTKHANNGTFEPKLQNGIQQERTEGTEAETSGKPVMNRIFPHGSVSTCSGSVSSVFSCSVCFGVRVEPAHFHFDAETWR